MRRANRLSLFLAAALIPLGASAQTLQQIEASHQPSATPAPSAAPSSATSTASLPTCGSAGHQAGMPCRNTSTFGDSLGLVFVCMLPPVLGLCLSPPHKLAVAPYENDRSIYVEPVQVGQGRYYSPDSPITRYGEWNAAVFSAANQRIYAHTLEMRGWLSPVMLHAEWTRFYEPNAPAVDTLDFLRLRIGSNLFGPSISRFEMYPLAGLFVLHGSTWTPAFDAGLEARAYPVKPLVITGAFNAEFFASGPALFDSKLDAGVSLGRLDVRAGARWIYQSRAAGFIGPVLSVSGKM